MGIIDLSNQNDSGISNTALSINHKEVHTVVIKSNDEQLNYIKSILNEDENSLKFNLGNGIEKIEKKDIEIIYKEPILFDNLGIAENFYFDNLPRGKISHLIDWKKIKENFETVKKSYGIEGNFKTKVRDLSLGNKKYLYICKHFYRNPKMIIIQEPMDYLSYENLTKVNKIIRNFVNSGGMVIYITKQWEEALVISNCITVMSKGQILGKMSAKEAKSNPRKLLSLIDGYHYKEDMDSNNVLSAIFKSAEYLTSEYELKDILKFLSMELSDVMGIDGCLISLIDSPTNAIIENYTYSKSQIDLPLLKSEYILDAAAQKDISYSNIRDIGFESMFNEKVDFKTIISVPIIIRTQLGGLISIYFKSIYTQTQNETMYLLTFARHAAIAIEGTRLLGQSTLLQESHHRIKNNLQSIITLVSMQKDCMENGNKEEVDDAFKKIISSIKSIASIHDLLSKNENGGSIINLKVILETLVYNTENNDIKFNMKLEDVFISYSKATSFAIVVNELLTNVIKHAYKNVTKDYEKIVGVDLKMIEDDIVLIMKDNGIGIPEDFNLKSTNSVGVRIVNGIISNDFQGNIYFSIDNGTTVKIIAPRKWMI
jgi:ribose transport system ATP-binding protein